MKKLILAVIATLPLGLLSCALLQPQPPSIAKQTSKTILRQPADLSAYVAAMDPKKKTVCSMTMNSVHERETFKKYLPEFNFIELVTESSEWLKESCEAGIKCDVLLVSGHFAGNFWGSSGQLELANAEAQACNDACPGIFQHPKEAYLFGCNTLGGKAADFRSPEAYRAVLIADGISPAQADMISAFRYSPLGDSFHDRMRAMFSGTRTGLYGFSSIAPSGGNVEALLQNYLQNVNDRYGDFGTYLDQMDPSRPNKLLAKALQVTTFAQAAAPNGMTSPSCVLSGKGRINEKLQWIDSTFRDPKQILAKLPQIDHYLETLEQNFPNGLPEAEASYFERLQFNTVARDHALPFVMKRMPGIWSAQGSVLNFAKRVGWLKLEDYNARVKNLIGDLFLRELSIDDADAFCASNLKVDLNLDMLPPPVWGRETLRALACSRTHDSGVIRELLRRAHREPQLLSYLEELAPTDPEVASVALNNLHHPDELIRRKSYAIISHLDPVDPRLLLALRPAFDDESLTRNAIVFLTKKRIWNSEFASRIRETLFSKNYRFMHPALLYFKEMKPQNEDLQVDIIQALVQSRKNLLTGLETLSAIKPRSLRVQMAMLDLLTIPLGNGSAVTRRDLLRGILDVMDVNQPILEDVMLQLLKTIPSTDMSPMVMVSLGEKGRLNGKKVQDFVIGRLKSSDDKMSGVCLMALSGGPFESAQITDILFKKLFDPRFQKGRPRILKALAQSGITDLEALGKIASLMQDPDKSVRANAVYAFRYLKTNDPIIRAGIVEALRDESDNVWNAAVLAMEGLGGWDEKAMSRFMDKMESVDAFDVSPFIRSLQILKPTSSSVLIRTAKFLAHEDPEIRMAMVTALRAIQPKNPEVLRAIRTHNPGLAESLERMK